MLKDIDLSSTPVNLEVATRTKKDDRARIFFGGPIITMTDGFFSPVEALVVEEDTIKYTGTLQGAKDAAGEEAIVYDLQERCLVPGSVEPHLHLILSAVTDHYFLKLSPNEVTTVDKALEIIRGAIGEGNLVGGKMVVGYGYDPSRVEETDNYPAHSDLTKEMLDKISTKYPIYIINQSGHVAYASTLTLENAGVTKDSVKDDESYQKDDKGELTGVIYEQALARIGKQVPQLTADLVFDYCNRTIRKWSSRGCTTVFDAGIGSVGPTDMVLLANLPKPDIRFYGALSVNAVPAYLAPIIRQPPFKLGPVEVIAIKYWADGSTQGFTAAVYTPYVNPPSKEKEHGTLNYESAEVLAGVIEPYLREGFQIVVHSNGDRATNQVLDTYEAVFEANPNRDKKIIHRIEHFTVTESTQLTRAARLGLGISQTIGHVSGWSVFSPFICILHFLANNIAGARPSTAMC